MCEAVSSHGKVRNHVVCRLNSGVVVTVEAGETSLDADMRAKEGCGGIPGGPGKSSACDREVGGRTQLLCGTQIERQEGKNGIEACMHCGESHARLEMPGRVESSVMGCELALGI